MDSEGRTSILSVNGIRATWMVVFFILAGLCYGCVPPGKVYDLAGWRDILKENGNWHMVELPDSKLVPGSIVKITEQDGLSWIDSLDSCGVPRNLLEPKPPDADKPTLVVLGSSPPINFEKQAEFSAKVMLNISGVKAGPEFANVGKVRLVIGENGGDAVRLIKLGKWVRDNAERFEQACLDVLAKPDHFLVAEAFRFSSAKYEMFDKNGAKLKLTLPQIGKILQFEPSVGFSVTASGELRIDRTMYVAVRRAVNTSYGFETLGSIDEQEFGDIRLDAYNKRFQ